MTKGSHEVRVEEEEHEKEATPEEAEKPHEDPAQQNAASGGEPVNKSKPDGQDWHEEGDDSNDEQALRDEENTNWNQTTPNEHQARGGFKGRKPQQKKKNRPQDDGFTVVPDTRFRGRGQGKRGGPGRGGYKSRGKWHTPKPHVARDPKSSHGKRQNWQIGEKRTDAAVEKES